MKQPYTPSSSVLFQPRFCLAFFWLFLIGVFSLPIGANSAEPIKLLSKEFHLGDQAQNDMKNPKPDGKVFEAKFDWPESNRFRRCIPYRRSVTYDSSRLSWL